MKSAKSYGANGRSNGHGCVRVADVSILGHENCEIFNQTELDRMEEGLLLPNLDDLRAHTDIPQALTFRSINPGS